MISIKEMILYSSSSTLAHYPKLIITYYINVMLNRLKLYLLQMIVKNLYSLTWYLFYWTMEAGSSWVTAIVMGCAPDSSWQRALLHAQSQSQDWGWHPSVLLVHPMFHSSLHLLGLLNNSYPVSLLNPTATVLLSTLGLTWGGFRISGHPQTT